MSIFHETMRGILEDIQKFLNVTLQNEHLSASTISHKESLLMKIHRLREEYPQLHLQMIPEPPPKRGPNSPPPYIDMQGSHATDYVISDTVEEDYEICDAADDKSKPGPEDKDVQGLDMTKYKKVGYLEKKGKERLGGLLNTSQRRWVALSQNSLLLFGKSSDKKVSSQLPLNGYMARQVFAPAKDGSKKEGCFELVGPGLKTCQFMASSQNEALDWIEAIQKCISALEVTQESSAGSGGLQQSPLPALPSLSTYSDESQCSSGDGSFVGRNSSFSGYNKEDLVEDEVYEVVEDVQLKANFYDGSVGTAKQEDLYQDTEVQDVEMRPSPRVHVPYPLDLYIGLWDCKASAKDELNFKRGDIIRITSKEHDEYQWWLGELNGESGLVPKQYIMEAYEMVN